MRGRLRFALAAGLVIAALGSAAGAGEKPSDPIDEQVDVSVQYYDPDPAERGTKRVDVNVHGYGFTLETFRQEGDGLGRFNRLEDRIVQFSCNHSPKLCFLLTGEITI